MIWLTEDEKQLFWMCFISATILYLSILVMVILK